MEKKDYDVDIGCVGVYTSESVTHGQCRA